MGAVGERVVSRVAASEKSETQRTLMPLGRAGKGETKQEEFDPEDQRSHGWGSAMLERDSTRGHSAPISSPRVVQTTPRTPPVKYDKASMR